MSKHFWSNLLFIPSLLLILPVYFVALLLPMRDEEAEQECALLRCTSHSEADAETVEYSGLVEEQAA